MINGRYPHQIIAMVSSAMSDRISVEADKRSRELGYRVGKSTVMREYIQAGIDAQDGAEPTLQKYAATLAADPDAPDVEEESATLNRLRQRGLY